MLGVAKSLILLLLLSASLVKAQEHGDGSDEDKQAAVTLRCEETRLTATLDASYLKNVTVVGMSIDDCPLDKWVYVGNEISTDFNDCAHNITQMEDIIEQEVKMSVHLGQNDTTGTIYRGSMITYALKCIFDRRVNVSLSHGVNVTERVEVYEKRGKTNFTGEMVFYSDTLFSTPATLPLQVTMFEPMYVKVQALQQSQNLYKFVVEDCYATPTADPNHLTRYMFFTEKCAMDTTFETYSQTNTEQSFHFKIDAFRFIRVKSQVFFHCTLLICKSGATSAQCQQQCTTNRRRRAAVEEEDSLERVVVNSGAIRYTPSESTCATQSCPSNSRCHENKPPVCRCNHGYVYDVIAQQCSNGHIFDVTNIHLNKPFLPSYTSPTSEQFLRLAEVVEAKLMTSYAFKSDVIRGVKLIGAREGSIVLELQVLYDESVTSRSAFEYFVKTIVNGEGSDQGLGVKRHISPLLKQLQGVESSLTENLLTIVIVVPIVVLTIFVVAVTCAMKQRRDAVVVVGKPNGYDNHAMS